MAQQIAARLKRPLIGVSGADRRLAFSRWFICRALRYFGADTVCLSPQRPPPKTPLHALVISGGGDIEPHLYQQPSHSQKKYDAELDAFEMRLLEQALHITQLPLLGICRGMQLLNVAHGGTLHQELRSRRRHTSNRRSLLPNKRLYVTANTQLQDILRRDHCRINSIHFQGIDMIGNDLCVAGHDQDNIVQAIELQHPSARFLLGVQWHPEYLLYLPCQARLFKRLVKAAKHHAQNVL